MTPTALEVTLDLTKCEGTGAHTDTQAAVALRRLADQIEREGICPGGVWGGVMCDESLREIGYWIVRP